MRYGRVQHDGAANRNNTSARNTLVLNCTEKYEIYLNICIFFLNAIRLRTSMLISFNVINYNILWYKYTRMYTQTFRLNQVHIRWFLNQIYLDKVRYTLAQSFLDSCILF